MKPIAVATTLAVLLLAACACPDVGSFGISVEAVDAISGDPLPGPAILTIRSNGFEETVELGGGPGGTLRGAGAFEQHGVFDVSVAAPGYREWSSEGVVVKRRGVCQALGGVHLVATLEPEG